jgi:phosphatidylinositol glycan class B
LARAPSRRPAAKTPAAPAPAAAPAPFVGDALDRLLVHGLVAVAIVVRVWIAIREHGIYWPDEIHQTVEQGHRLAFGHGLVSWEFQDGLRSWALPGILAGWLKLLSLVGVDSGLGLMIGAKLLLALGSGLAVLACARVAERLAGPTAAIVAAGLSIAFPASLIVGMRLFTEAISAPLIMASALLIMAPGRRRAALAGALVGLSYLFRYQNGVVAAGFFFILLRDPERRRGGEALSFAAAVAAVVVGGGLLDWLTWGSPFYSLIAYVRFNMVQHGADKFGTSPPMFYVQIAWQTLGAWLIVLVIGWLAAARRAPGFTAILLTYWLIHVAIPHKEARFLYTVVPLALALAAVGFAILIDRWARGQGAGARRKARLAAAALVVVATLGFGWRAVRMKLSDVAIRPQDSESGTEESVWGDLSNINRSLSWVGQQDDACGVVLAAVYPVWTGGYSYLHRDIPLLGNPDSLPAGNYAITSSEMMEPPGYELVKSFGGRRIFRRDGACEPPPPSYSRLLPRPD